MPGLPGPAEGAVDLPGLQLVADGTEPRLRGRLRTSIYGAFRRRTGGLSHVKTAGTSYLEGLRTLTRTDPGLFREVYDLVRSAFSRDLAAYEDDLEHHFVRHLRGIRGAQLIAIEQAAAGATASTSSPSLHEESTRQPPAR